MIYNNSWILYELDILGSTLENNIEYYHKIKTSEHNLIYIIEVILIYKHKHSFYPY